MAERNRTSEILEVKARDPHSHPWLSHQVAALQRLWKTKSGEVSPVPDFYVIRAVTIVEVSVRRNIARMIDHGSPYLKRAVDIAKQVKMDFETVSNIQDRAITLGDLISHSLPVSSVQQIHSAISCLLAQDFRVAIEKMTDPSPVAPVGSLLIADYDRMAKNLNRLFEVRHVLVHELPRRAVYETDEIAGFLNAAYEFTHGMEELVHFDMYGETPRDQTSMNQAAYKKHTEADAKLAAILEAVEARVREEGEGFAAIYANLKGTPAALTQSAEEWLSYLHASHTSWKQYCDSYAHFNSYFNKGGTIWSMFYSSTATAITERRIEELEHWLEADKLRRDY
jgi:hypothetical protein